MEVLKTLYERGELGAAPPDFASLGVPERVGLTIERRLKRLSPGALRLAQTLAAWQTPAPTEALAAVLELREREVAELFAELHDAQVFRAGAFVHDLLYETVRRSTPREVGRLLHRKIALLLEHQEGEPARAAYHWEAAGELERSLPWRLSAAEVALAQGSVEQARAWLMDVLRVAAPESALFGAASVLLERSERVV